MLAPSNQAKIRPAQPWGHIPRHHCGYQNQGAGATHGINQGTALGCYLRPAGAEQDSSGQVFLEWRVAGSQLVAALVQATARQVQVQLGNIPVNVGVDSQVWGVHLHAWPMSDGGGKLVHHRILDSQRCIVAVANLRCRHVSIDGQGARGLHMQGPVDGLSTHIQGVRSEFEMGSGGSHLLMANSHTLGTGFSPRIEVPNTAVDVNSWYCP